MRRARIAAALIGLAPGVAWAHGGAEPDASLGWPEAALAVLLAASGLIYATGLVRLRRRAKSSRPLLDRRAAWFSAGWLTVSLALLSPLHGLAERFFWAHMVEHELLMAAAAPLLVASQPQAALIWGLGAGWARRFAIATPAVLLRKGWSWATQPLAAWSLHTAVLWVWHVPGLFEAALRHEAVHAVQHVSFLGVAVAYWSSIAGARHGLASRGVAVLSLFATSMQCGLLGALLALGTVPLYPTYAHEAGFDPIFDQQLAGVVMWVPVSLIYGAAAIPLLLAWLREAEASVRKWEARL
jgi:putative membrane protein